MNTHVSVSHGLSPVWVLDNRCTVSGMTEESQRSARIPQRSRYRSSQASMPKRAAAASAETPAASAARLFRI